MSMNAWSNVYQIKTSVANVFHVHCVQDVHEYMFEVLLYMYLLS